MQKRTGETMRKPIQIAHAMSDERGYSIVALCNDGTIWEMDAQYCNWRQIGSIPQDPDTGDKCETLTFHGINKQAAEINSALDNENERLNWKLEATRMALRNITEVGSLYCGEKRQVEYCIERARIALEETE
jgi:hypothetical protein